MSGGVSGAVTAGSGAADGGRPHEALERHALYPSLVRPVLWGGVEPPVVILEVVTALALVFGAGPHLVTVGLALFYLTVVHGLFAWVAAEDPLMTQLYVRSLAAADYYSAQPALGAKVPAVRPAIPRVA